MRTTMQAMPRRTAVGGLALVAVSTADAQPTAFASTRVAPPSTAAAEALAPVPFAVREELTYEATFGALQAGTARMCVAGVELVRGRPGAPRACRSRAACAQRTLSPPPLRGRAAARTCA